MKLLRRLFGLDRETDAAQLKAEDKAKRVRAVEQRRSFHRLKPGFDVNHAIKQPRRK